MHARTKRIETRTDKRATHLSSLWQNARKNEMVRVAVCLFVCFSFCLFVYNFIRCDDRFIYFDWVFSFVFFKGSQRQASEQQQQRRHAIEEESQQWRRRLRIGWCLGKAIGWTRVCCSIVCRVYSFCFTFVSILDVNTFATRMATIVWESITSTWLTTMSCFIRPNGRRLKSSWRLRCRRRFAWLTCVSARICHRNLCSVFRPPAHTPVPTHPRATCLKHSTRLNFTNVWFR